MRASIEATHVASYLVIDRDAIVSEWEERVLADEDIPTARKLSPLAFGDYVPKIIDALSDALRGIPPSVGVLALMHLHANLRRDAGYSLAETLAEIAHLYEVVRARAASQHSSSSRMIASAFEQSLLVVPAAFSVGTKRAH